ncbi:MAG: carboxy terminal-processing peptidase [Shewanellaceae bacterium]|nr:carboxy terminal-processing peptidase [Shewanellaceae bacterium]
MFKPYLTVFLTLFMVTFTTAAYDKSSLQPFPELSQEPQHKIASKRANNRFSRAHYHRFKMDKAFSNKIFERYINTLDSNRSFFLQQDIDEFRRYQFQFTDMFAKGELQPAFMMFNRLSHARVDRFTYALSLLKSKPIRFDVEDDQYLFDRSEASWALNQDQLNEIWRKRVKSDALNLKLAGKKWPQITEVLQRRYESAIKRIAQTQSEDVFQILMNAYARSIEPHTSYLSPRSADKFDTDMSLSLEGIGAVLQIKEDYTVIRELVKGGPADKSQHLHVGDKIIGVGKSEKKLMDVIGWRIDDVVDLIKGPKGSSVYLNILREKDGVNAKPVVIKIVRDKIYLEDRAVQARVISPTKGRFKYKQVGVITIPSFYINLTQDTQVKLQELKRKGIEALIVDLRGNGGGVLVEATMLTSLFVGNGPVVQIRNAAGKINVNRGRGQSMYEGHLVVLVDRYSASASEIFAAAIQDYRRGLIVGESTFGKGTVQQHSDLGRTYDMHHKPIGFIQYTIAKFYRINGESTQLKGVEPDIAFPSWLAPGEHGEANEDNALAWDTIYPQRYRKYDKINSNLIASLADLYKKRIKNDPEFNLLLDIVAEYRTKSKEKTISLVESQREAERTSLEQRSLERINKQLSILGKSPVKSIADVPDNFEAPDVVLNQTVDIALDMVQLSYDIAKLKSKKSL